MTPEQKIKFEKDVLEQMGYEDEAERVAGQPDVMSAMVKPYEYVKNPKHYQWFDIEVIDAIEKQLTHEQFKGFLMGTSMRYRFRCGSKPGEPLERDIDKAKKYEEYWYDYVRKNTP